MEGLEVTDFGFCFLDIETTGLDPKYDSILEIAYIVTTADLEPIMKYSAVLDYGGDANNWPEVVRDMHIKSGLIADLDSVHTRHIDSVNDEIYSDLVLIKSDNNWTKLHLAGNSIHFDAGFLREHMPKCHSVFHHRMLDISSFKLLGSTINKTFDVVNDNAHRALSDCWESLNSAAICLEWIEEKHD